MDPLNDSPTAGDCLPGALRLVQAKYLKFVLEFRKEREKREKDLPRNLAFGGRAKNLEELRLEFATKNIEQWAKLYKQVAKEQCCPALLLKAQIDHLREQMLVNLQAAKAALIDAIAQDFRAAGDANPLVLEACKAGIERRFQPTLLDTINAELNELEAEGNLAVQDEMRDASVQSSPVAAPLPAGRTTIRTQSRKRGPTPDITTAQRIANIVARVAPDGEWRSNSRLDDLSIALDHGVCDASDSTTCEASDHEKIPIPRGWRQKGNDWLNLPDRATMVKAIEYRLMTARKNPLAETPS
jgi:hypothetical protein